jgi:hypothetical protein
MRRFAFPALLLATLAACSSSGGPFPSLQPRAAENIDPRLPVTRPMNARPVSTALASRLAKLVSEARSGDSAFEPVIAQAERLAAAAGAPSSESWIAAQQALSDAVAARGPTAAALGDIDSLGATTLQTYGGMAPNDLAAIKRAGAEVFALDQRQAERIEAIQRRLGV